MAIRAITLRPSAFRIPDPSVSDMFKYLKRHQIGFESTFFIRVYLDKPVEKPDFVGTRQTSQERSFFSGDIAALVAFPCEIPFFFVAVAYGVTIDGAFHVHINAEKRQGCINGSFRTKD